MPTKITVRPLFAALAALIAGILCAPAVTLPIPMLFGIAAASGVAGVIAGWRGKNRLLSALLLLLPIACIGIAQTKRIVTPGPNDISHHIGNPSLWVRGIVMSEVETRPNQYNNIPMATFTIAVNAMDDFRAVRRAEGKLRVTSYAMPTHPLSFGETVWLRGRVEAPIPATNPGAFDYAAYLRRRGVFAMLAARRPGDTRRSAADPADTPLLRGMASTLRTRMLAATAANLPREDAALLDGLLLSSRSRLPAATVEAFTRTGTVHVLSFSGLHLAVLAACLLYLLRLSPLPRHAANIVVIILLWVFALAAGGQPSAVRAAVMATVFLAAPLFRRSPDARHSLGAAALLLLFFDPLALFDAGFQLSFATVATLLLWAAPLQQLWLPWEPGMGWGAKATRAILVTLLVGALAHLGSAPLAAYHFNRFSVVAPLANVFVTLLAEAALITGMGVVFIAPLLPAPLAVPLWELIRLLLMALRYAAEAFAWLPYASYSVVSPPVWVLLVWYALLGGGALVARAIILQKTLFAPASVPAAASDDNGLSHAAAAAAATATPAP